MRDRLMNHVRARAGALSFNALLRRYLQERLLYRLSVSPQVDSFLLKGGLRLVGAGFAWARVTRDIDLLGYGDPSPENLARLFREVCAAATEAAQVDGVRLDPESVTARPIREQGEYGGIRVKVTAYLGSARETLQIDVGFGDVVTPGPVWMDFPALLAGMPAPRLRAVTDETTLAEKLHALLLRGAATSRTRDFYDLYAFAATVPFTGPALAGAITHTFTRRKTPVAELSPTVAEVFSSAFARYPGQRTQWQAFRRSLGGAAASVPEDFPAVMARIEKLVRPVLEACARGEIFAGAWDPGAQTWTPAEDPAADSAEAGASPGGTAPAGGSGRRSTP